MRVISEEEIQREYIAPIHFSNFKVFLERAMKSSQVSFPYIVSFRKTGMYSVNMLNAGAAAKPHTILDKTIKPGKITADEADCKPLLLLYGLVASRDSESDKINGIHQCQNDQYSILERGENQELIPFIAEVTGIPQNIVEELQRPEITEEYILQRMADRDDPLWAGRYASRYVAGDYDLHDLISKVTCIHPIPSDSEEEFRALNDLNKIMMEGKKADNIPGFVKHSDYPVQHGPQYNYVAHMLDKEPDKALVMSVAEASFPVLMLRTWEGAGDTQKRIEWLEINNIEELKTYYEENSINMKSSWKYGFSEYIARRQCEPLN